MIASMDDKSVGQVQTQPTASDIGQPVSKHEVLNAFLLAFLIIACLADIAIVFLVIHLVSFAYAPHSPTDVNALFFPVALVVAVIAGIPASIITFLLGFGYYKTKPRPVSVQDSKPPSLLK